MTDGQTPPPKPFDPTSRSPEVIARAKLLTSRLDHIEGRLLAAEAPADFVPDLARAWGISRRHVWRYVARVRARLAERARASGISPEADAEIIRAMLLDAYRTARAGGEKGPDAKGMVAAARALADVTGVTAPRRVDVTSGGKPLAAMTDEELDARIAALEAQAVTH